MDCVIPYIKSHSQELLWSVLSLQNIKHGNVYVIGDKPDMEGIIHLEDDKKAWSHYGSYWNQASKYLTACNNPDISDDFVASNDDFFVMSEWQPINYNRGTLSEHIQGRRMSDQYQRSLMYTEQYLEANNYPALSFELHTPFVYNKRKLKKLIESLPKNRARPLQIRSLYGNIYGVETERIADVKNISDYQGKMLLSTNEKTFTAGDIGEYIRFELGKSVRTGLRDRKLGEKAPTVVLNTEKVLEIKKMLKDGKSGSSIARLFNVNHKTISDIKISKTWLHV